MPLRRMVLSEFREAGEQPRRRAREQRSHLKRGKADEKTRAATNRRNLGRRPGGNSYKHPVRLHSEHGPRAGEFVQRGTEESRERHLATAAAAKEMADERIVCERSYEQPRSAPQLVRAQRSHRRLHCDLFLSPRARSQQRLASGAASIAWPRMTMSSAMTPRG